MIYLNRAGLAISNSHSIFNILFCRSKTQILKPVKKPLVYKNGVSSVACSAGFASCKTFDKQPKHPCFGAEPPYRSSAICATASCSGFVWLTASILAWTRGGSPSNLAPARMPGVYAQRLCARTHTSGRTKSVQDAPTTNDHDCTDAEPTKHTQPFTMGKGFGVRDREFALFL